MSFYDLPSFFKAGHSVSIFLNMVKLVIFSGHRKINKKGCILSSLLNVFSRKGSTTSTRVDPKEVDPDAENEIIFFFLI